MKSVWEKIDRMWVIVLSFIFTMPIWIPLLAIFLNKIFKDYH